jgi:hypothetical protein
MAMTGHEERVKQLAEQLWREAGSPAGGPEGYDDQARTLVAIEENPHFGTKPVEAPGPYGEPVEEASVVENLGEFPTLTDEGEQHYPPEPEEPGEDVPAETPEPGRDLHQPEPDLSRRR